MTRLYLLIGGAAVVASLAGALWWAIQDNANLRAERDGLGETINNARDFNEGAANPDDCNWLDRLRETCPD
ncbi:hypothetical protein [Oceaniglobus trochenteri]|uniref:hypothetical protein n=1 Tax=Oceaniglobus trochenteri TaxID=2763260 RepID=UPI001CFFF063|nr:hypothetical protein [Oceaniglobus trochenteri]